MESGQGTEQKTMENGGCVRIAEHENIILIWIVVDVIVIVVCKL